MKKILFLMAMTLGIISCGQNSKVEDRNASTQNPIMPIIYAGDTLSIYLTDYLPQVEDWNTLKFFTEPSYQVVGMENGILALIGDYTLSILTVLDEATGIKKQLRGRFSNKILHRFYYHYQRT